MSPDSYVLVKIRAANIFVRNKDLPRLKELYPQAMVIAPFSPSSDHLMAFIGLPGFPIYVERGLAVVAGKTLSIGIDLTWCEQSGKHLYYFEDGGLVGKRV